MKQDCNDHHVQVTCPKLCRVCRGCSVIFIISIFLQVSEFLILIEIEFECSINIIFFVLVPCHSDQQCNDDRPFCDIRDGICKGIFNKQNARIFMLILNWQYIIEANPIWLKLPLDTCSTDSHCTEDLPFCDIEEGVCKGIFQCHY